MQLSNTEIRIAEDETPQMFDEEVTESSISILLVDDNLDMLDLTATFLEREGDGFETVTESTAVDALSTLEDSDIDAIVSDYDMPDMNGLEFLGEVRDQFDDIPFILFTGKGSEEIASEAISKGVTDYLQKETNSSQYSLLANRIQNAVSQYRSSRALQQSQEKFSKLVMNSSDVIAIVDEQGRFEYISPASKHLLGYEQSELIGESAFEYMPTEDRERALEHFFEALENPNLEPCIEFRFERPDGGYTVVEARGKNLFDDDFINGFVVNGRDITSIKEQQQELKQQNEQLKDMRQALSHDLRNPLSIAWDSLNLYQESDDEFYLDKIETALRRIDTLLDQIVELADHDTEIEETEQVSLEEVAKSAWEMVDTAGITLHIEDSKQIEADPSRLQQLIENLIRNANDHSDANVTVNIGTFDSGIYVEDDGPGIPEDRREKVFETGYTTSNDNNGYGLNIVKQIVLGHGWDITITESTTGGARFEISGVTFKPSVYD